MTKSILAFPAMPRRASFTGRHGLHGAGSEAERFSGVILQKQNRANGVLHLPIRTGAVSTLILTRVWETGARRHRTSVVASGSRGRSPSHALGPNQGGNGRIPTITKRRLPSAIQKPELHTTRPAFARGSNSCGRRTFLLCLVIRSRVT